MIRVIGFEGTWPQDSVVAWGAAALQDGSVVWNSFSRHSENVNHLSGADSSDAYTTIEPVDIRDDYRTSDVVVVGIRLSHVSATHFRVDTDRIGGFVQHKRSKGCLYYILKDRQAFDAYANEVVAGLFLHLMKQSIAPPVALDLITAALSLAPHSPYLHAMLVVFSNSSRRAVGIANASLRTDQDKATFQAIVTACNPVADDLWLKYEHGIAAGGGLDIDVAVKQFHSMDIIHRNIKTVLVKRIPYLDDETDIPPFRLRRLKVGSADIALGIDVDGEPLISRVARYMELRIFQEILRGNIPQELSDAPEFLDAVEALVHPTPETVLSQRGLGADRDERVYFETFTERDATPELPFSVFGFVQGTVREVKSIEIRLFPKMREVVSIETNGHGQAPDGADVFRARNDFLFLPAVFVLQRFVDPRGRYKFFLQSVRLLEGQGSVAVDAIPSTFVPGAFMRDPDATIERTESGRIVVLDLDIRHSDNRASLGQAESWMREYAERCRARELELASSGVATWVPPVRPKPLSAMARILLAVSARGGSVLISDLTGDLYQKHGVAVRRNNTRREIRENPELIVFDSEDDERVVLTELGHLYVSIYTAALNLPK